MQLKSFKESDNILESRYLRQWDKFQSERQEKISPTWLFHLPFAFQIKSNLLELTICGLDTHGRLA